MNTMQLAFFLERHLLSNSPSAIVGNQGDLKHNPGWLPLLMSYQSCYQTPLASVALYSLHPTPHAARLNEGCRFGRMKRRVLTNFSPFHLQSLTQGRALIWLNFLLHLFMFLGDFLYTPTLSWKHGTIQLISERVCLI